MYPNLNLTGQQVNTSCDESSAFELVKFIKSNELNAIFIGTSANKWKDNTLKINKDGLGNAESWVGVGGGGGGLKSSQVLEYISSPLDGSIIKTNNPNC